MQSSFELLRATRRNVLNAIEGLSLEQINAVPKGFNNTIGWNFVHGLVTQQILCYKLSNLPVLFGDELVEHFKKGSKGNAPLTEDALNHFKAIALPLVDQLEMDFLGGQFKEFSEYTTSYNFTLRNVSDAITMNNAHEGLHLGYIMALKRAVLANA
jgi:hypothetical protein